MIVSLFHERGAANNSKPVVTEIGNDHKPPANDHKPLANGHKLPGNNCKRVNLFRIPVI